jgi:hypothetical protein
VAIALCARSIALAGSSIACLCRVYAKDIYDIHKGVTSTGDKEDRDTKLDMRAVKSVKTGGDVRLLKIDCGCWTESKLLEIAGKLKIAQFP